MSWAMSDQALISGINFLTGLLLARYLGLAEFGRFTLAWMAVEFLLMFQQSLIVAPMMSIGPKTEAFRQRVYFGAVVVQQGAFTILSACLFFIVVQMVSVLKPEWGLDGLILPLLCAGLAAQLQNFFRRYLFTRERGDRAFLIDLLRYFGQLAVFVPLFLTVKLDAADCLWVIAATSALSVAVGGFFLEAFTWDTAAFRNVLRRHWDFAKWLLSSEIMQWGTTNLFLAVAGGILGTAAVGAIRAAQLILGVCNIMIFGMENFALVRAARHFSEDGVERLMAYLKRLALYGMGAIASVALVAAVAPELWLGLIDDNYRGYGDIVRWWALFYCVWFVGVPISYGLRTIEGTRTIFSAYLIGALFSAATVYPIIDAFGINGAMVGIVSSLSVRTLLLLYGFRRRLRPLSTA
jgi:O-antigen/teichoic acid export membrane protein